MKRLPLLFLIVLGLLAACDSAEDSALATEARKPKVGHMTGSFKVDLEGVRYTGAVNLYCDASQKSKGRNLQINWRGHRWHLGGEALRDLTCSKVVDPSPPRAAWNVMTATAGGTLNGEVPTEISFVFSDKGEPGRRDTVSFTVRNAEGDILLRMPETALSAGSNLQAHFGDSEDDGDDGASD